MTVPPSVTIIDDGAAGFTKVGTSWKTATGQGYLSDITTSTAGTGSSVATWTFGGLTAGQYRVSATWTAQTKRATNSPFTVLDGSTALATVLVSQKVAPNDFSDSGAVWENLGGPYQINGPTLVVRLTNQANGVVVADAVRIELVTSSAPAAAPAVGDGSIANTSHSPTIGSTAEQPTQAPPSVSPPMIFSASLLATPTSGRATLDPPRSTSAPVAELSRSANPRQQTTTGARLQLEAVDAFFGLVGAGVLEAFDTTGSP